MKMPTQTLYLAILLGCITKRDFWGHLDQPCDPNCVCQDPLLGN